MFEIKVEAQFKVDYKRTMRMHPQLKSEFKAAVAELVGHFRRSMAPTSSQTRAETTTATSISTYPMAWSMWSFFIFPIRLTQ